MGCSYQFDHCFQKGKRNLITDVPGVRVGHKTLAHGEVQTGVTAILPHGGNMFREKVMAAVHVINGFGKSVGTVQVEELGTLETPILLTNTHSVGTVAAALTRYMQQQNPQIGREASTVNPVVMECNDGFLNDIRGMHVTEQDAQDAIEDAREQFEEGAVGAGRGMSCYHIKGGIGSSSRILTLDGNDYTIGALVLSNFGRLEDMILAGKPIGRKLAEAAAQEEERDKGSIIVVLATDVPMIYRQVKRMCKRAVVGITRTGGYTGHGSGEIAIGFTTANRIPHFNTAQTFDVRMLAEDEMENVFRAAASAVEEAIISSMLHAPALIGRDGHYRASLSELLKKIGEKG